MAKPFLIGWAIILGVVGFAIGANYINETFPNFWWWAAIIVIPNLVALMIGGFILYGNDTYIPTSEPTEEVEDEDTRV